MNKLMKKVLTAVAVKEAFERVQEMRAPKPTLMQRMKPVALLGAIGGGIAYLFKSGRLNGVLGKNDASRSTYSTGMGSSSAASPSPSSTLPNAEPDGGTK